MTRRLALAMSLALFPAAGFAQDPAAPQPPGPTASVNTQPRVDVLGMPRPIEMHDSVWIEDLTMMEVRGNATINGVSLVPAEKTIENGKKIAAFRAEKTIAAVKKSIAGSR